MAETAGSTPPVQFKTTLNLPHTDFPIRAHAAENDPQTIARWSQEDLASQLIECNKESTPFILHDGPPYANGAIHIGHAYNKILKDIVTKSQRMMGKNVRVIPGWDCHGLPIEIKVTHDNPGVTQTEELKKLCRAYAQKWIVQQKEQFKQLGVMMDWDHAYTTMSYEYEADIVRSFAQFVKKGYIERKNKTVPWCASCQTVLASAEIEYQERKDPSIFVTFTFDQQSVNALNITAHNKPVSVLVWTTTPWTLPLNQAVLLKPHAQYVLLPYKDQYIMVGSTRAQAISTLLAIPETSIAAYSSEQLTGLLVHHPFIKDRKVPLIADNSVLIDDGTAFVHCAPGAGPEDYDVGVRNNLDIYSPVSSSGHYTDEIKPEELAGMAIVDGQIWVLKALVAHNALIYKTSLRHSYPHCWRCHNGLIFRATKQWFCDLSKNNLKHETLEAIKALNTVPVNSKNRLSATVEGRLEWCLSRQRVWGTPITALLCKACDKPQATQQLFKYAADCIEKEGIEWWDTVRVETLIPFIDPVCSCKNKDFKKETDILDVWFDSGVSHQAVLKRHNQFPADMYLEGKDQHRGWFQSSLLTSMVLEGKPPMKTIMTHGFTVDGQGKKMSKSLGNTISPQEMIDRLGTDGLRLWAAMIDCSGEAVVSDILLNNVAQVYKKIRNTARFLLSVLYDYNHAQDAITFDELTFIDKAALKELVMLNDEVIQGYATYNFTAVAHALGDYCTSHLSALYLDIIKDRLYCDESTGKKRRSAQTVCYLILDTLNRLCAPILSITSELIFDHYKEKDAPSIHTHLFKMRNELLLHNAETINHWDNLLPIRSAFLKAIETVREQGIIKHSLEAHVVYFVEQNSALSTLFESIKGSLNQDIKLFLKEFLIVSQVTQTDNQTENMVSTIPGLWIHIQGAQGDKCPRCWHWNNASNQHGLCNRCQPLI